MQRQFLATIFAILSAACSHVPEPTVAPILAGDFHQVAHIGSGRAAIFQDPAGRHRLRISFLDVARRPDLEVLLLAAPDATDNAAVLDANPISLGPLGQHSREVDLPIPANLDLARYRAVTIWSPSYQVNFLTAPLVPTILHRHKEQSR